MLLRPICNKKNPMETPTNSVNKELRICLYIHMLYWSSSTSVDLWVVKRYKLFLDFATLDRPDWEFKNLTFWNCGFKFVALSKALNPCIIYAIWEMEQPINIKILWVS